MLQFLRRLNQSSMPPSWSTYTALTMWANVKDGRSICHNSQDHGWLYCTFRALGLRGSIDFSEIPEIVAELVLRDNFLSGELNFRQLHSNMHSLDVAHNTNLTGMLVLEDLPKNMRRQPSTSLVLDASDGRLNKWSSLVWRCSNATILWAPQSLKYAVIHNATGAASVVALRRRNVPVNCPTCPPYDRCYNLLKAPCEVTSCPLTTTRQISSSSTIGFTSATTVVGTGSRTHGPSMSTQPTGRQQPSASYPSLRWSSTPTGTATTRRFNRTANTQIIVAATAASPSFTISPMSRIHPQRPIVQPLPQLHRS